MAASERMTARQVLRIKSLRQWFGLSQGDFARMLGTGRSIVARWEATAGGPPSQSVASRRALALDEIRSLATKAFRRQAKAWFRDRVPIFNGATPLDTLIERGPSPVLTVLPADREGGYL
jgi:transcriptional regulator with XRE-family HTH domain